MNEKIKKIQLILICDRNEDKELYDDCIDSLKDFDLSEITGITEILKKLILDFDGRNIEEKQIKKLRDLFQIDNICSYEYELTMELLFKLIDTSNQLNNEVIEKLLKNLEHYFFSKEHVSFSSLHVLLYYFYEKKYKDKHLEFEENYKLVEFLDGKTTRESIPQNSIESRVVEYLKLFINHNKSLYKTKTYHMCHHLNICLSLTKMIEFAFFNVSLFESIKNLVLFIGATNVGKSTVINYLGGVEYELSPDDEETLVPKAKEGNYNRLKCGDGKSNSSVTLYSELLKIKDKNNNDIKDKDNNDIYSADPSRFF